MVGEIEAGRPGYILGGLRGRAPTGEDELGRLDAVGDGDPLGYRICSGWAAQKRGLRTPLIGLAQKPVVGAGTAAPAAGSDLEQVTPSPSKAPPTVIAGTPVFLCSPLARHDLAELPQIVSAPYAPPVTTPEDRHHVPARRVSFH